MIGTRKLSGSVRELREAAAEAPGLIRLALLISAVALVVAAVALGTVRARA